MNLENSKNKTFQCNACEKSFTTKHWMNNHKKSHSLEVVNESGLKNHQTTHISQRKFNCKICGKELKSKSSLNGHEKTHSKNNRYKCQTCTKFFDVKASFERHNRIHTGEILFECITCGRGFNDKTNLTKHIRSHSGGKTLQMFILCKKFFY